MEFSLVFMCGMSHAGMQNKNMKSMAMWHKVGREAGLGREKGEYGKIKSV
jgi:hypothetical protein